jgi:hypothetical protein
MTRGVRSFYIWCILVLNNPLGFVKEAVRGISEDLDSSLDPYIDLVFELKPHSSTDKTRRCSLGPGP